MDHIIEVGGTGTLHQSLKCIKFEGVITLIGFLGGFDLKDQPGILDANNHICTVRGVYVGSRAMMKDMIRAIEANNIHPVVDERVFSLDKTRDAYEYMVSASMALMAECARVLTEVQWAQKHFGKVTIKIN